jgi:hypothetical protein
MNTPRDYVLAISKLPVSKILIVEANERTTCINNPSLLSIRNYVAGVKNIQLELRTIQSIMIQFTRGPIDDDEVQVHVHKCLNSVFRGLLAEKTRQEAVQKMRNYHGSTAQNSSTRPTNNTPRSVCIRDILQKKIAGCAE